ncbi:Gfo/Idh/MocA family oxidoreductase [Candidatus Poribacteria bacterium]|nr:Gfo/Idh/MocA family oxidoreductase [Candidatus Poribacteria bacterium]
MNPRVMQIALVGAGMFGADVHLRTYADLERCGIAPYLGRIGMDDLAREFSDVRWELVAVATRSPDSASRAAQTYAAWTGKTPRAYYGDAPWEDVLSDFSDLRVLSVATPDDLHAAPVLAALRRGVHAVVEKPMTLTLAEADAILEAERQSGCLVGLDMHKRYDPDHLHIFTELLPRLGAPLYGRAVLEEPLEVSTSTFKWATRSDPFSYVGVHWTDLFIHYLKTKPASLHAIGQKRRLADDFGIDAYDAVQVSVVFDNGLHVQFNNHWINPSDFEGPVNQECEIVAARGKIESDSQYRGLRYTIAGGGSRTTNTHFTRLVSRPDGSKSMVGYGKDSLVACLLAMLRRDAGSERIETLRGTYPNAHEGRLSVAIIEAAKRVRDMNAHYLTDGRGTPVTATFGKHGVEVGDPIGANHVIYSRPV